MRSPDASRPLTLCNCDCKIITTVICFGLRWPTIRCIHPAQRCISTTQMTDNIFEPGAFGVCPSRVGYPLDGLRRCIPSINHSWMFHVLKKAELPRFICRCLRSIYVDSNTEVEFAWKLEGISLCPEELGEPVGRLEVLRHTLQGVKSADLNVSSFFST